MTPTGRRRRRTRTWQELLQTGEVWGLEPFEEVRKAGEELLETHWETPKFVVEQIPRRGTKQAQIWEELQRTTTTQTGEEEEGDSRLPLRRETTPQEDTEQPAGQNSVDNRPLVPREPQKVWFGNCRFWEASEPLVRDHRRHCSWCLPP